MTITQKDYENIKNTKLRELIIENSDSYHYVSLNACYDSFLFESGISNIFHDIIDVEKSCKNAILSLKQDESFNIYVYSQNRMATTYSIISIEYKMEKELLIKEINVDLFDGEGYEYFESQIYEAIKYISEEYISKL